MTAMIKHYRKIHLKVYEYIRSVKSTILLVGVLLCETQQFLLKCLSDLLKRTGCLLLTKLLFLDLTYFHRRFTSLQRIIDSLIRDRSTSGVQGKFCCLTIAITVYCT